MMLDTLHQRKRGALAAQPTLPDADAETRSFDGLLAWALNSNPEAMPRDVVSRAALLVADELAALFAAAGDSAVHAARDALLPAKAAGTSAIMSRPLKRASIRDAAMANAVALSWMELDEGYAYASCHAGLYALPTLAAHADASGKSVRMVLGQVAIAYEVLARLAAAYPAPRFTWHPHGMWSSLGAALARCLATKADFDESLRGLRNATSLASLGGYEAALDGAEIRNMWAAIGVANGFVACELALAGLDGPAEAPDSILARLTGREAGRVQLLALGANWALFDSFTKEYACCQSMHTAIDAALEIRACDGFSPDDVASIEIETPRTEMDNAAPVNRLAAQFSLPHAVAVTLLEGRADADCFSPRAIGDPDVARLRRLARLTPWQETLATANARPATVRVVRRNGEAVSRTRLQTSPMSLDERRSLVISKIRAYGSTVTGRVEGNCARLMNCDKDTLERPWKDFVQDCFGD